MSAKELFEKNKKLKEEYITLEKDYGTCELENSKLRDKINKAIEYIESYNLPKDLGGLSECPISVGDLKELLKILKGEENE